jgi:uncharacterized protein (DUF169 family)
MNSKLVDALRLATSPVAVILTDTKPEGALQFKEGRWGCVGSTMLAVSRGRTAVFDRESFGCPGGGVGLGFGNQYEQCNFAIDALLSTGAAAIAEQMNRSSTRMGEGERFFKTPELVRTWLASMPITDVPTEYVAMKPFDQLTAEDDVSLLIFFVNADQLSALAVMTGYSRGTRESVIARFGGACQSILFGYAEAQRDEPRGIIGFFDIAQRSHVDKATLSFTVPWTLFLEMEANVAGSFLEMEDWRKLRERQ